MKVMTTDNTEVLTLNFQVFVREVERYGIYAGSVACIIDYTYFITVQFVETSVGFEEI